MVPAAAVEGYRKARKQTIGHASRNVAHTAPSPL